MAKGYEDVYDVRSMGDGELRELVMRMLRDEPSLDDTRINVAVRAGTVCVRGRLGTEQEVEAVEQILLDRLGFENIENELVVDELVRASHSEAADEAAKEVNRGGYNRHSRDDRTDPEAAHLIEDVESELYGTEDMGEAIEQGESYTPPETPHEEGLRSHERH